MSRKDDTGGVILFAIFIILIIIFYVVKWMIDNWVIILGVILIIGAIYALFKYVSIKEEREQAAQLLERKREQEIQLQKYETEQKEKGFVKFTDRFGKIKWGSPDVVQNWIKEDDEAKIKESLLNRIVTSIQTFKPSRKWAYEDGYHKELLGYLQHDFPNIKYEFQSGSSRPDLVIDNIAIEVKGPTDNPALDTLTTKCLKYSKYYDNLIMVLFNPQFSEGHFREIKEGIEQYFPHVVIIKK